jgi:uncharacterized protein with GYD domain
LANRKREETIMPSFLITANFTEQGIRNVKDVPKRDAGAREAAKKLGVEIKQIRSI